MGNLAALLIVSLIRCFLQIKGKQAEQAEVIAFPSEDKSGSFAIIFGIKTAEENGFKLNCFSVLQQISHRPEEKPKAENHQLKLLSFRRRMDLFYTGCTDAVLRYIRDRPLAVVMTTAVFSTKARGFGSFTC